MLGQRKGATPVGPCAEQGHILENCSLECAEEGDRVLGLHGARDFTTESTLGRPA